MGQNHAQGTRQRRWEGGAWVCLLAGTPALLSTLTEEPELFRVRNSLVQNFLFFNTPADLDRCVGSLGSHHSNPIKAALKGSPFYTRHQSLVQPITSCNATFELECYFSQRRTWTLNAECSFEVS